jgi:CheY-like chemotaxis protein
MLSATGRRDREFPHILVVDDDGGLQLLVRGILEQYGFMVDVAADGRQATEMAARTKYDAIVCDVVMPHMDGCEFYAGLQQTDPEQARRLIFVTGAYLDDQTRDRLQRTRRTVIRKPFNIDEFEQAVAEALRQGPADGRRSV